MSANAIETKLRASRDIAEAIVFGASKPMLGVLVVPASSSMPKEQLVRCVQEVNASSPSYATILDDMIICLPHDARLPKTSKGTIIRPQIIKQLAHIIEDAYRRFELGVEASHGEIVSDDDVKKYVRQLVLEVLQDLAKGNRCSNFEEDDDLFALGLTSLHAIQIRGSLQKACCHCRL